tara:strand:- start:1238 stop:5212 length:3975 start_codon:yes stop_codon:yes gene_type:complete
MIQLKVYKQGTPFILDPVTGNEIIDEAGSLYLDLYETEPIKLTLSIEDITNADASSVFSKTFRVPATRDNNEFFENAYAIDGIDFDVTVKNQAEIIVDGAEFREGHIRLQKIYTNDDLDRIDYELLFLGETRDFSSIIGESTMCQMNFSDFTWEDNTGATYVEYTDSLDYFGAYDRTDIIDSWEAYYGDTPLVPGNPLPALTDGFAAGNILFPLINHGNTYNENNDANEGRIALGGNADRSFTTNGGAWALAASRMKPMIRAKRAWDQIFEDAGYTYTSDFLLSPKFHQMYISAFGNNESIEMEVDQTTGTVFESNETINGTNNIGEYMYNSNTVQNASSNYDEGTQITGSKFTVPVTATSTQYYIMSVSAQMAAEFETPSDGCFPTACFLRLEMNVGGTLTTLATSNGVTNMQQASLTWDSRNDPSVSVPAGAIIKVYLDSDDQPDCGQNVDNTYWDCTAAPGDYYAPLDLDCDYKQIDFIKDVLTMFRLVMQPDNKRPNNFIIEPWQDFIGSGVTYDWSHKLVQDKDMVLEPLFNTQSSTIEFSKAADDDFINKFHQDNNKNPYGYLQFNSANELLKGTRKIEVKGISPTPLDQIDHNAATNQQPVPQWVIPNIYELTGDISTDGYPLQVAIKPNTRFLFYNGKQTGYPGLPIGLPSADLWYLVNNTALGYWPMVSPYSNWPVQQTSLNLNFSNDTRYYIDPTPGAGYFEQGSTLFDAYWSRYISSLYDKYSRRLTAKFILNNVDLQDLTFDDVIFVNGKYYRPEKIIDAQVGAETEVTCQLITLGDQRPVWLDLPLNGFSVVVSNGNCIGEQGNIQITTGGTPAFTWELDVSGAQGTANPGGTAPYTFTIDAPVGIDTLTVTDLFGRTAQVQVSVPASTATPVTSTFTQLDPTDCTAPCNGEIDVTPAGGAGAPYTVIWNDGVTQEDRTGLCPGNYQYYVEDVNGCQSDIFNVDLTCQIEDIRYQLREHLNNCTQSSSAIYIATSTSQLPINQTVTLNERAGCYYVQALSTDTALYTIDALSVDCVSCNGGTALSYEVETCGTGANTYYASRSGSPLSPGDVVQLSNDPGCYEVIGDSTNAPDNDVTTIHRDCAGCTGTTVYKYKFLSCDGLFDGPIESPVQLALGSFIDITPGPGCGSVYANTAESPTYTWNGQLLYEDCDACNGIAPPPAQNCHLIGNGGLVVAQGTYILNGSTFSWTVKPGTTSSYCAEVGSVVITSGNVVTINDQGNACTQPGDCLIGPPPPSVYTIEDCATSALFTMDDQGSQFQIGDVIQYYANTQGTGARYCGTVINYTGTTLNAFLANPFVSYFCGDTIHCAE